MGTLPKSQQRSSTRSSSILPVPVASTRLQLHHDTTDKRHHSLRIARLSQLGTSVFDRRLTHFRRSQLHWLDVVDRVRFRVCVQVFRCLHKMAPEYLSTYCQPVAGISGRRHLRSADRGHLDFPRVKLASYGRRLFAYAGPSNWNSLPAHLRDNCLSLDRKSVV